MDTNELEMAFKEWGDEEEISKPPSTEEMAAIPVASPEQAMARRSKRPVGEVNAAKPLRMKVCPQNPHLLPRLMIHWLYLI
jgi:hypothetical protein